MLCKTYDESLQKQAVNMDLQCILYIADSSYAVKTPKDEVTCDTYWNFYKKLKIWTCFLQNRRFWDQTGGQETTSQNGSLLFKMGGLEHLLDRCCMLHRTPQWSSTTLRKYIKLTLLDAIKIHFPRFFTLN